jgi:hypothetical protein
MKKTIIIALALVFALSAGAWAFGIGDVAKAAKNVASAKDNELKLSGIDAGLAKYEGTPMDPSKAKKYTYKTFGDPSWDKLAESSAKTAMCLDFAEKVINTPDAKKEDLEAAQKALEPLAKNVPVLVTSLTQFVTGVASDASKAVMLKEAKSVADNMKLIAEKAPKLLDTMKTKIGAMVSGGVPPVK